MKRAGVILILLFAFAGLADSMYIAHSEATNTPLICNVQGFSGCETVANSPYSKLAGIPLAEYGILFYAIVFAAAALELAIFDQFLRRILQALAVIGVLFSLYFMAVQVFVIGALCLYCFGSAVLACAIGVTAGLLEPLSLPLRRTTAKEEVRPPLQMPPGV